MCEILKKSANFDFVAVRRCENLVDLEKSEKKRLLSLSEASIQPRMSLQKCEGGGFSAGVIPSLFSLRDQSTLRLPSPRWLTRRAESHRWPIVHTAAALDGCKRKRRTGARESCLKQALPAQALRERGARNDDARQAAPAVDAAVLSIQKRR